jgi:hypothetical protein
LELGCYGLGLDSLLFPRENWFWGLCCNCPLLEII